MDKAEYIFEKLAQMVAKPDTTTRVNELIHDGKGGISARGTRIITQPGGKADTTQHQTGTLWATTDKAKAARVAGGSQQGPMAEQKRTGRYVGSDRKIVDDVTSTAHAQIRGGLGKIIKDKQ